MATRKQSKLGRDMGLSPALAERAYALLLRSGGGASTAKLTRRVLGSARSAPWRPIFDALLDADPRFERTGSGWRLATPPRSGHRPPQELVALALATTGSVPERHRVVRLSAVRLSGDQIAARFDVVVNSRRRLARHLLESAGLGEEAAEETPSFAEIAEPLREFLGDAPIIGFGIAAALEFLTVELSRAGKPGLANRQVELDMLARLLLTERRKPS
ncbi:MAG TPA: 3'-5' exonuclease, partial [Chloroflexota bacterium]|nr:3'-5' exonuclease [Chloroflexota bacterium]